jgi:hypothetical protein
MKVKTKSYNKQVFCIGFSLVWLFVNDLLFSYLPF